MIFVKSQKVKCKANKKGSIILKNAYIIMNTGC